MDPMLLDFVLRFGASPPVVLPVLLWCPREQGQLSLTARTYLVSILIADRTGMLRFGFFVSIHFRHIFAGPKRHDVAPLAINFQNTHHCHDIFRLFHEDKGAFSCHRHAMTKSLAQIGLDLDGGYKRTVLDLPTFGEGSSM